MHGRNVFDPFSLAKRLTCNGMSLDSWYCENINKWLSRTRGNNQYRNEIYRPKFVLKRHVFVLHVTRVTGTARIVPAVAWPLAGAAACTTSAVPDCSTNHDSVDRINGQFLFYHDHNFIKSKGNLLFRRLVPLCVPIVVCATPLDDGTASDVTIGMWRHNQQSTNHERNGEPWFSLPK